MFEEGQGEVGIVLSLKVEDIEVAGGEVVVVCLQKLVHRAAFSAPIDGQKKNLTLGPFKRCIVRPNRASCSLNFSRSGYSPSDHTRGQCGDVCADFSESR